jgi:predicted  nucleic acid-binding Zn-ribbon protein
LLSSQTGEGYLMKAQIEALVKLQTIEMEADTLKAKIDELPAKFEELDRHMRNLDERVASQQAIIGQHQKEYRNLEGKHQDHLSHIEKSQANLMTVNNNKEYQAMLKEIDDLKNRTSAMEDAMLEHLDLIESTEKELVQLKRQSLIDTDLIAKDKKQLEHENKANKQQLNALLQKREAVIGKLDASLLEQYRQVKADQIDGRAIVPVKDAICHGCNLNIPPQMFNELQKIDQLIFCPHCQRFIYWQP